jgi:phage-related minor tail protein
VKGLIAQFIKRVIKTGFGVFAALTTAEKSIFTMIGYIMKKRQIAMGMETLKIERASSLMAICGAILPSRIPIAIQIITHAVRYFSKMDSFFVAMIV